MNYSYFVGLDVGKKSFDACLMSSHEQELGHSRFSNSPSGINKLLTWISSYGLSVQDILFCAENMGTYVTDLSLASIETGFDLALACPLSIKRSIGLQRGKNDRIDAKRIANYAALHYRKLKLYHLPDNELLELRAWMIIRDNLVKEKVSLLKLHEAISDTAKLSDVSSCITFLNQHLKEIKQKIQEVEAKMQQTLMCSISLATNYKLLTSITGVGMINAVMLLCLTDNFRRFTDPRKFACYAGVAPFEHTSGISIRGKTQTSHLAKKEIKVQLTRAAITAMCHDPGMKSYFKRKTGEGKHKASVINAIRAKIIARCFAVVRRQTPYVKLM